MPKRRINSLMNSIRGFGLNFGPNPQNYIGSDVQTGLVEAIEDYATKAQLNALRNYSADMFPAINGNNNILYTPADATYVSTVDNVETKEKRVKPRVYGNTNNFVNDMCNAYHTSLLRGGSSPEEANRLATMLTKQSSMETGYGRHIAANHNYGGHRINGKYINYSSDEAYADAHIKLLDKKWGGWRNAKNEEDFGRIIHTGKQKYSEIEGSDYGRRMKGTSDKVNNAINMGRRRLRCGGSVDRPKAFLGAIIGAATSLIGSAINAHQNKLAREAQEAKERRQEEIKFGQSLADQIEGARDYQRNYEDMFRMAYKSGGRRRLRNGVSITDGGYAIPMGNNTFLLRGGSHEDVNETGQTGIGLNIGGKEIEAEGGEVVQKTPREVRIFSTSPMINGVAPADAVKAGADKDYIFAIQQMLNGDYNGDNTRRSLRSIGRSNRSPRVDSMYMRNGGRMTPPVGRIKADDGIVIRNGRKYKRVRYPNSDRTCLQDIGPVEDNSPGFIEKGINWLKNTLNQRISAGTPKRTTTGTRAVNYNAQTGPFYSSNTTTAKNETKPKYTNSGLGDFDKYDSKYGLLEGIYKDDNGIWHQAARPGIDTNSPNSLQDPWWAPLPEERVEAPLQTTAITDTNVKTGTGRRRIASRGTVPTITPFSSDIEIPAHVYEAKTPFEMMTENGFTEQGKDVIAPLNLENGIDTAYDFKDTGKVSPSGGGISFGFDWNNLGSAIASGIGNLGSALIDLTSANRMSDPQRPAIRLARKLPTFYNIRPQLDEITLNRNRMLRDSNESSSSVGRLQRRNYINTASTLASNQLWSDKANKENEMLTRDALNQQEVSNQNISDYNTYLRDLAQQRNYRRLAQGQALGRLASAIPDAVGGYFDQLAVNKNDERALNWYLATLGEREKGWFINAMRNKRNRTILS